MNSRSYNQPYTKDELLAELRRFYEENGRSPIAKELKCSNNMPSLSRYQKEFSTLNNALQCAMLPINRVHNYSKEFLISEIRRFVENFHRVPRYGEMCTANGYPSPGPYEKVFGTWNKALKVAGYKVNVITDYTNVFLINEIKRFYVENNRSPAISDFNNNKDYPSVSIYQRRFGSWDNSLDLANVPRNDIFYTKDFLISKILDFYNINKRVPLSKEFTSENGYPSYTTYTIHFGTWVNALEAAGLAKNNFIYSDNFLISELYRFIKENNKTPTRDNMNGADGYPSGAIYHLRFGSWNKALEFANIQLNKVDCYAKQELIEYVHQFVASYNHVPHQTEMDMYDGYPSGMACARAFGTWNEFLIAAELPLNKTTHDYDVGVVCESCGTPITSDAIKNQIGVICCRPCYDREWKKLNPEKAYLRQHRHYKYGFTPINKKFECSEGHHLHVENVTDFSIFIPNFLHKLHWHNHHKSETMTTVNAIAFDFWLNEEFYTDLYLTGG